MVFGGGFCCLFLLGCVFVCCLVFNLPKLAAFQNLHLILADRKTDFILQDGFIFIRSMEEPPVLQHQVVPPVEVIVPELRNPMNPLSSEQ